MKKWFNSYRLHLLGATIGGIAGYFYWQQFGCASGTCAITSKPVNSTSYGAFMGGLVFSLFKKNKQQA